MLSPALPAHTVTYSEDEPGAASWERTTLTQEDFAEALEVDRSKRLPKLPPPKCPLLPKTDKAPRKALKNNHAVALTGADRFH